MRLQDVPFPVFRERSRAAARGRRPAASRSRALSYSPPGRVRAALARVGPRLPARATSRGARGRIALAERGDVHVPRRRRGSPRRRARAGWWWPTATARRPPRGSLIRPGIRIPAVAAGAAGLALRGQALLVVDTVAATRRTRNVIAERPGPAARRVAMLGAHLDSVREGPGINDNGSGVAATLALAERLRDRRGLRFGFWGAEELGLYGSRGYVDSLSAAERRRIAGYINLDMVGSPNPVRYVYGDGPVREALERGAARARAGASTRSASAARSDHAPFEDAGISVGGLYSGSEERKTARQARALRRPRRPPARPLLPPPLRHARARRPRRSWPSSATRPAGRSSALGLGSAAMRLPPRDTPARRRLVALAVVACLALVAGVVIGAGAGDDEEQRAGRARRAGHGRHAGAAARRGGRRGREAVAAPPGRASSSSCASTAPGRRPTCRARCGPVARRA